MKRWIGVAAAVAVLGWGGACIAAATDADTVLTRLNLDIVGMGLTAGPDYQAVPKGIATQVGTGFDAGDFEVGPLLAQLPRDYTVRAELSGPAFPTPRTLTTRPGQPFDIPTLALLGKHTLSNIRLVNGAGETLYGAMPQAVVIESINDPLITEVKTRPLTLIELQERGVTFDSSNFTAYEFTAAIGTSSGQIPLTLPVIIPTQQTLVNPEDIPAPDAIGIPQVTVDLTPPEIPAIQVPRNLAVSSFVMQIDEPLGDETIVPPPIPGVVIIPGNIGFLHQYFSALALVSNGAPLASGLSIRDVQARIVFPAGEDLVAGSDAVPGDDPLRMAKGGDDYFARTQSVLQVGADGKTGTADDLVALRPGETGQADFTIEGLKEGTHAVEFAITAVLDGLPVGPVTLHGSAKGAVLVRNPDFALTLAHPQTVRSGEGYDLFVTVTNTGKTLANLVSVTLDPLALSGAVFADGETAEKGIATILPGSSETVRYRLVSQRTGAVTATAFESAEVKGRFSLRAGVGERNIPLSPDSLILPYIGGMAPDLVEAAVGLLGQAWSVATAPAGALPADVLPITKRVVTARAYDLSEAGLRLLIGDTEAPAVADLTFDLYGSDKGDRGFDDLRRHSTQGERLNRAIAGIFANEIEHSGALPFQAALADKVSYRPGHLSALVTSAPVHLALSDAGGARLGGAAAERNLPYADRFILSDDGNARSTLALVTRLNAPSYRLELMATGAVTCDLGIVLPDAAGVLRQWIFTGVTLPTGGTATAVLTPGGAAPILALDVNGDGVSEESLAASSSVAIPDHGPQIVAAAQIIPGFGPGGDKHGRNVAVLFSETVPAAVAQEVEHYSVDANAVKSVTLQPGGRMAFLLLRDGIGPFFERSLTVDGLSDAKGLTMPAPWSEKIWIPATTGPAAVVDGVVREASGAPVAGATVRLMQYIWHDDGFGEEERYAIFSEKKTEADGSYHFDFVLQNNDPRGPFMLEAIHPQSGEAGQLSTSVIHDGQRLTLDLFMRARGSLSGRVLDAAGRTVAGASVQIVTLTDNRTYLKTSDATGAFAFTGLTVGAYRINAVSKALLAQGSTMGTLPEDGSAVSQDVSVATLAGVPSGEISGRVLAADGETTRGGVIVVVRNSSYQNWMRSGSDGRFYFAGVTAGNVDIEVRDAASGERIAAKCTVADGAVTSLNLLMPGTGIVDGTVQREDGKSAAELYVIASYGVYKQLTQTDAVGHFRFAAIPVGDVRIEVLDPRDYNRTVASGQVTVQVAGGTTLIALFVPGQSLGSGTIYGTVYRADGTTAWSGARVYLADLANSSYVGLTSSDHVGYYEFPDLPLNKPHALVVVQEGEVINAMATLIGDGQKKPVNLRPFVRGSVTGTTWDDAEKTMPAGADVTLTSMKPNALGWLVYNGRTTVKSDPNSGRFSFGNVYQGSFAVSASNIFRPTPVMVSGNIVNPGQVVNVDLPLKGAPPAPGEPAPVNTFGTISGQILLPNGQLAGAGVRVTTNFGGADVTVTTDAAGLFRFNPIIPAGNRPLVVFDPITTRTCKGYVVVVGEKEVTTTLRLLGRGTLAVRVLNADGTPAPGSVVAAKGTAYPNDAATGTADGTGLVTFANLTQGGYAVTASGSAGRGGAGEASLPVDGATVTVEVRLAPAGRVSGTFYKADGKTPIGGGQIKLLRAGQAVAYATSSSDAATPGRFQFNTIPLGNFTLEGFDPLSERLGRGAGSLAVDGATVTADVRVVPQGTVRGTVLNYGGTAPIDRASVRISATSYHYTAVTGADGGFIFAGVSAGSFTLDATNPDNGLLGRTSGAIGYEAQIVEAEIRIAPSGSVEGKVFLPDMVTAALKASVVFQGQTVPVDSLDGRFRFDNLALGTYTLKAYESGSNRVASVTATVRADGEIAQADVVLKGVGTVSGYVKDNAGKALGGASVLLTTGGLANASDSASSAPGPDNTGFFQFINVPVGAFTLQASHTLATTKASASGTVNAEGETVNVNLTLGPVATLTGTVFLPDGLTPAFGGGVQFVGDGRTFNSGIDAAGRFTFAGIPLPCSYSLTLENADGRAIGVAKGDLSEEQNDTTVEIDPIVLDDQAIAVTLVEPAPGALAVPVNSTLRIVFSEPAKSTTVNSSTVKLLKGTTQVSGSVTLDNSGTTVTFAPPLVGLALYTVVVDGVKDLVGRPLASPWRSTFTTIDNIPPTLSSIAPADGATQVAMDAVVRLTFSEAIDANALAGIRLLKAGAPVATDIVLVQGGTVAILTPTAALALNSSYSVEVSGVRDLVGNVQNGSVTRRFTTLDTIGPEIASLTVPAGTKLIKGQTATITATIAAGTTDTALVDFFVDGIWVTTDSTPFSTSAKTYDFSRVLDKVGTLTITAIAQDKVGNRSEATPLTLEVAADQPPTAHIILPAPGSSVNTGANVTVKVDATDDVAVKEIALAAGGVLTASVPQTFNTSPVTATFTLAVPTTADPSVPLLLTATAKDGSGQTATAATVTLTVVDSIAPSLTLSSPGTNNYYEPGESGVVSLTASDNIGVISFSCTAGGAAVGSREWEILPARQAVESFPIQVAVNAIPHAAMNISCTTWDAAGQSVTKQLNLTVADVVPPALQTVTPSDGVSEVPTNTDLVVVFDEALLGSSVTGESVQFISAIGEAVAVERTLSSSGRTLTVRPVAALQAGASYTLTVDGVTDLAGNPLAQPFVMNFSTDGTAPLLLRTTPFDGGWNVTLGTSLVLTFSEAIDVASLRLDLASATDSVPLGAPALSADGRTVTVYPVASLDYGGSYTATLQAGVRDLSGNQLADARTVMFRTVTGNELLPAGLWHFDGDGQDASGNGNHVTPDDGVAWVAPGVQSSAAVAFSGTNQSVQVDDAPSLHAASAITVSGWFEVAGFDKTWQTLFWKGDTPDSPAAPHDNREFSLWVHESGYLSFTSTASDKIGVAQSYITTAPGMIETGQWYHVAAVIDARRGVMRLYLNGREAVSGPYSTAGIRDTAGPLYFGANPSWESTLNGKLDELAIYPVALTADEVLEQYTAGLSGDRTPPAAPTVQQVLGTTAGEERLLYGSKESGASVRVNGVQVAAHDAATTWQAIVPVSPGQNRLEITSRDPSGNSSKPLVLNVERSGSDVIGRWHMDGDWSDASGNGRNGAATGASFTDGPPGEGLAGSFDGQDDYVALAIDKGAALPANNFTIEFWARPDAVRTATTEANTGISGTSNNRQLALFPLKIASDANAAGAGVSVGSDGVSVYEGASSYFPSLLVHNTPLSGWHHVVVVYNDKTPSLYLDGSFVKSGLRSLRSNVYPRISFSDPTSAPWILGKYQGALDEVAIHNRALSAAEVDAAYRSATSTLTLSVPDQGACYRSGVAQYAIDHGRPITRIVCTASVAASGHWVESSGATSVNGDIYFGTAPIVGAGETAILTCTAIDDAGQLKSAQVRLAACENDPPVVVATTIADGAVNVSRSATFSFTFNTELDPAQVTSGHFDLRDAANGNYVANHLFLEDNGRRVIVAPITLLEPDRSYTLVISEDVADLAGNRLGKNISVRFRTEWPYGDLTIVGRGTADFPLTIASPTEFFGTVILDNSVVRVNSLYANSLILRNGSDVKFTYRLDLTSDLQVSGSELLVNGEARVGKMWVSDGSSILITKGLSVLGSGLSVENSSVKAGDLYCVGDSTLVGSRLDLDSSASIGGRVEMRQQSSAMVPGSLNLYGVGAELLLDESWLGIGYLGAEGKVIFRNQSVAKSAGGGRFLRIDAPSLEIDATSQIDASAAGYTGGAAGEVGTTIDGASGSTLSAGGSHGGKGGRSDWAESYVTATYGDPYWPVDSGSGAGGHADYRGGNGGRAIVIFAQTLLLNGAIRADGEGGVYAGGSGGGICITANLVTGAGKVLARGGDAEREGGGAGGGGRIAIYYGALELPRGQIFAHGGRSFDGLDPRHNGGAGTVLLYGDSQLNYGEMIVDNNGISAAAGSTLLLSLGRGTVDSFTPFSLSVAEPRWTEGIFDNMFLFVRPNLEVSKLYTVRSNTATTLDLYEYDGELTGVEVGATFSGVYPFDVLTVAGGAQFECADLIEVAGPLTVDNAHLESGGVVAEKVELLNGGTISPWN